VCERVARERTKAETAAGEGIERAHTEKEERSIKKNRRRAVEKTPSAAATTQIFMAIFSIPCSAVETPRSKWFMAKLRAPNWREKSRTCHGRRRSRPKETTINSLAGTTGSCSTSIVTGCELTIQTQTMIKSVCGLGPSTPAIWR
jgi:hypothetical protein